MDKAHNFWCGNSYPWARSGTFSSGFCLVFRVIPLTYLQLVLKVMYYDVETNNEMHLHIEKVVNAAGEKTRLGMENVRLAMELSTKRQIDDAFNGIRAVIRDEVHNHMRIRNGEKEK